MNAKSSEIKTAVFLLREFTENDLEKIFKIKYRLKTKITT